MNENIKEKEEVIHIIKGPKIFNICLSKVLHGPVFRYQKEKANMLSQGIYIEVFMNLFE